jgi:hypothetical protein
MAMFLKRKLSLCPFIGLFLQGFFAAEEVSMKIEDYVIHKTARYAGTVVIYGKRLVDGKYITTLQVRLRSRLAGRKGVLVEDLVSN